MLGKPMETMSNSQADHALSCAECALLMVVSVRFAVFKAAFGRLPESDEPLFFDPEKAKPTKAGPTFSDSAGRGGGRCYRHQSGTRAQTAPSLPRRLLHVPRPPTNQARGTNLKEIIYCIEEIGSLQQSW